MESLAVLLAAFFILTVYLIPTIIAFARGHASKWGIGVLNIILGWSLVFWVIALIWSLCNKGQNQVTNVTVVQTNGGSKAE